MPLDQIRFVELLENKTFHEFVLTKPKTPRNARAGGRMPWRLYAQMQPRGRWAKKDFIKYGEAVRALKQLLPRAHDLAVCSRSISYHPPGRWVNLSKGGKPLWLLDAAGKPVLRDGQKVRRMKFVTIGMPPGHAWCMYCRRPTVFTWFSQHHAFTGLMADLFDRSRERCTICGITAALSHDWQGS